MKVLAFAGSNSTKSINHELLEALIPFVDADVELISLRDYEAPIFSVESKEEQGIPEVIHQLHLKIAAADALMVSAAEHNGSMTAALKNTFDWLSMFGKEFFLNKPTVFLSTSPGPRGGASVLKHLLDIMPYRGAEIVGSYGLGNFANHVNDGKLSQEAQNELLPILRVLESTAVEV